MKYFIAAIIIIWGITLGLSNIKLQEDIARLKSNQELLVLTKDSLNTNLIAYKTKDSLNAISLSALQLERQELETFYKKEIETIKKSRAHAPTVQQVITSKIETHQTLEAPIKIDSIANTRTITFEYTSNWTDIKGAIIQDSVQLDITNRESLILVKSLERKKFWFIKLPVKLFGYRRQQLDIISENPNTCITKTEYIEVIK